ncbi:putative transposase [Orientia tsutsugamushi str. Gilliam]|uniref:Putative transposase n=1 Tax=Orientia tsutsugamushi str. Gilliam TaxID=1359184 RepID=A0A0F3MCX6_ORITS|nr:putative transposase [Orientia tsutsugamushi str. Gilliam]
MCYCYNLLFYCNFTYFYHTRNARIYAKAHSSTRYVKALGRVSNKVQHVLILDKEKGYIYLRSFLWYTDTKLLESQQPELEQVLAKYLSEEEKGNIMRTIAAKYIDEGIEIGETKGIAKGIEIGETKGIAKGRAEGIAEGRAEAARGLARKLLKAGFSVEFISENTGLSKKEVINLKNNIEY